MKLENLKIGMEVKNYPELCKLLELDVLQGNSKKAQMLWFDDYFSHRKDGHKFIIKDIYSDIEIKPMRERGGDMSDNTHIEYIEKLILDLLVQDKSEGEIFLSKSRLFEELSMVNENYGFCTNRVPKLAKFTEVQEINAEEWFTSTSSMLERNLNKALNRLEDKPLISWSKKITVCKINPVLSNVAYERITKTDNYGEERDSFKARVATANDYREGTPEEIREIIKTEHNVIEGMNCKGKQDVIVKGRWSEFERKVKDLILKNMGIAFYWNSYHIIFNPEHVLKGSEALNERLLKSKDRDIYQNKLNRAIQDNVDKNSNNRSIRAKNKLDDVTGRASGASICIPHLNRRADDNYVKDSTKLSDALINNKALNIKSKVISTKL